MHNIQDNFNLHLNKVASLLAQSAKTTNQALWLYKNNLRTPFFMLQGLARVYVKTNGNKYFEKLLQSFKAIEDVLGDIDHYDNASVLFAKNKSITPALKKYFTTKTNESLATLQEILVSKKWYSGKKIEKITKKLAKIKNATEEEDLKALAAFYNKATNKIYEFAAETKFVFDNVEEDVHELRRKIRWLSIYPHALAGSIKLVPNTKNNNIIKHYLTTEIKSSPFNQFKASSTKAIALALDKNSFLATSWLINELGTVKDNGLKIHLLQEALVATSKLNTEEALLQAYKLLGTKQVKMEVLLQNASINCAKFFNEEHLKHLVVV